MADDGRVYCERIQAAGGRAHWVEEPGLVVHGYLRARDNFDRILAAIGEVAQENWPF